MTPKSKKIIKNYFNKIEIHKIKGKNKSLIVKSVITFVSNLEEVGLIDKLRYCYPFMYECPIPKLRGVAMDFKIKDEVDYDETSELFNKIK